MGIIFLKIFYLFLKNEWMKSCKNDLLVILHKLNEQGKLGT